MELLIGDNFKNSHNANVLSVLCITDICAILSRENIFQNIFAITFYLIFMKFIFNKNIFENVTGYFSIFALSVLIFPYLFSLSEVFFFFSKGQNCF